ncbi:FAD/NAD(P)-binding domain-containing protein [Dothidotthia symphoricarpi CBS 119687]|uniref:FAD/NAD(P)-binding domain-containing protein n=1 Tax=Dothidotthia symphoricarpi CBS 119687 TaxID=1392245 RepID=A0A6A5ZV00_9PLEO|nr:FAD/NAD(P)-binding domain-containing protein [Dothidotthia symphoricarpi CBS 119687]KAF2123552.1 FAD/NAD(P)-binding domain-containing protein [Dothidotthia symphoricarpi CBS 119687]
MAPDLNSIGKDGQWDYSTPGSTGYNIPDIAYDVRSLHMVKLRVLTIGTGVSGIQAAYQIQKNCENVEHVMYEKNAGLGGTWLENRYPGAACDVPSHAYTMNFALNPDWPRFFSHAPDIEAYLRKVCEVFDLLKYMTFNTEVIRAEWQDNTGKWKVSLRQKTPSGETREFEDECDLLLYATGFLNSYKWPKIKGVDKFKGRVVHTAAWPEDYQKEQWANDRVAIIGSGASSIQTVPNMQPFAKHLDVFVRTGVWFVQVANNYGQNKEYSQEERDAFRNDPKKLVAHAKDIENQINGGWGAYYTGSEAQKKAQDFSKGRMQDFIKDKRLLEGFTPKFEVGCRRVTPGDPYMVAIQKENVDVHFTAVEEITEKGAIGGDGVEREVDTIVCATGFDVSYRPRFPVIGKNGVDLHDKWKTEPLSYLGLGCPDMPNMIMFVGPTWPVENGSVTGPLLSVAEYALQVIKKMQRDHIKSWVPRQDITDRYNEHAQEWIKHTVWKSDCRAWYRDNDTGRVNAIWPGSSNHYAEIIATPRYEDFEIEYQHKNPWAHIGMGSSMRNINFPNSDVSPYLQVENIDPKWLHAIGYRGPALEVENKREEKEKPAVEEKSDEKSGGEKKAAEKAGTE